ncbi:MAG TPA: hypothetical protein VGL94_05825 [Ktedonobacteraceae bacterium]|jgi:hypothetical protein
MNNSPWNNQPYGQRPPTPKPTGLEAKFQQSPGLVRWGLIGCSALVFVSAAIFLVVTLVSALGLQPQEAAAPLTTSTAVPTPSPTPSPVPTVAPSIHYPPTTVTDLRGLAAEGDASAIHPFHSESVGVTGVCPQPKTEVTVDPSVTGQQLAEDLLAYFYAQQFDNNPCGVLVVAYHDQSEAGNAYTAGRISVNVTDSSGASNIDPNASNLKHQLTLDTGPIDTSQEYVVTY